MIQENAGLVMAKLTKHRAEGGSLSVPDGLGPIAEETGLSRRIVEAIYKRHGSGLKKKAQSNPEGASYFSAHGQISWPRRSGRPIL